MKLVTIKALPKCLRIVRISASALMNSLLIHPLPTAVCAAVTIQLYNPLCAHLKSCRNLFKPIIKLKMLLPLKDLYKFFVLCPCLHVTLISVDDF